MVITETNGVTGFDVFKHYRHRTKTTSHPSDPSKIQSVQTRTTRSSDTPPERSPPKSTTVGTTVRPVNVHIVRLVDTSPERPFHPGDDMTDMSTRTHVRSHRPTNQRDTPTRRRNDRQSEAYPHTSVSSKRSTRRAETHPHCPTDGLVTVRMICPSGQGPLTPPFLTRHPNWWSQR